MGNANALTLLKVRLSRLYILISWLAYLSTKSGIGEFWCENAWGSQWFLLSGLPFNIWPNIPSQICLWSHLSLFIQSPTLAFASLPGHMVRDAWIVCSYRWLELCMRDGHNNCLTASLLSLRASGTQRRSHLLRGTAVSATVGFLPISALLLSCR